MRQRRDALVALAFLAPAALLLTGVVFYPILQTFYASVCEVDRKGNPGAFGTLKNFHDLAASDVFTGEIIPQTLVWTAVVVVGTMLISMFVALALNEHLPGRRLGVPSGRRNRGERRVGPTVSPSSEGSISLAARPRTGDTEWSFGK